MDQPSTTTGAVKIWYLGVSTSFNLNTDVKGTGDLSPQLTNYLTQRVVGSGDYDGDGLPDLVVQNLTTNTANAYRGNVSLYLMNQGALGTATIAVKGAVRQMNPQITNVNSVVKGADDIRAGAACEYDAAELSESSGVNGGGRVTRAFQAVIPTLGLESPSHPPAPPLFPAPRPSR